MTSRPPRAARRFGHLVGAAINAALLGAVNWWPGWESVSFLTADTPRVLPLFNLSLAAGLITSLIYVWNDAPRLQALGGIITSAVGLPAAAKILSVFPFDLDDPYVLLVRIVLIVAVVGSAIAIIANLVSLFRSSQPSDQPGSRLDNGQAAR